MDFTVPLITLITAGLCFIIVLKGSEWLKPDEGHYEFQTWKFTRIFVLGFTVIWWGLVLSINIHRSILTPYNTEPKLQNYANSLLSTHFDGMPSVPVYIKDQPIDDNGNSLARSLAYYSSATLNSIKKRSKTAGYIVIKKSFLEKANEKELDNVLKHELIHAWLDWKGESQKVIVLIPRGMHLHGRVDHIKKFGEKEHQLGIDKTPVGNYFNHKHAEKILGMLILAYLTLASYFYWPLFWLLPKKWTGR